MKQIKYQISVINTIEVNGQTEEQVIILTTKIPWSEANEEIAKKEAYKGEYTIEDDGQPEPTSEPTQLDRVEAQVTYTAMMTDTLLEV